MTVTAPAAAPAPLASAPTVTTARRERVDLVVVGGGIVGLATARAALLSGRRGVVVFEAESEVASHQTGHNSGVIHSGLYYRPGSSKAANCARGRELMVRYCAERGIPHQRCGKVVIATETAELPRLAELRRRGEANGLVGMRDLDAAGIRELEPEATGIAGLFVAETGIVDYRVVSRALAAEIVELGGEVRTGWRLRRVVPEADGLRLESAAGTLRCAQMVNCAGLESDRVARLAGARPGIRIVPFRGDYYELLPERAGLVRGLIYPVPDPSFPFLGVHFTRGIDGKVEAGPNAVPSLARGGYGRFALSPRDVLSTITFPGTWKLARRVWRIGLDEAARSLSRRRFASALQRLVPAVAAGDLRWAGCGVRAQALDVAGNLLDDFHIVAGERAVHVLNAPSPGATASLSIGESVAAMAAARLS